jgi:hypothetical protein
LGQEYEAKDHKSNRDRYNKRINRNIEDRGFQFCMVIFTDEYIGLPAYEDKEDKGEETGDNANYFSRFFNDTATTEIYTDV